MQANSTQTDPTFYAVPSSYLQNAKSENAVAAEGGANIKSVFIKVVNFSQRKRGDGCIWYAQVEPLFYAKFYLLFFVAV